MSYEELFPFDEWGPEDNSESDDGEWLDTEDYCFLEPDDAKPDELFPAFKDKKQLLVPHLQRMDDYIKIHYQNAIDQKVCRWVNDGLVYADSETPPKAVAGSVSFEKMRFWRKDRTELLVDIQLTVLVDVTQEGVCCQEENRYFAEIRFWMNESKAVLDRSFFLNETEPVHGDLWELSEYLIPHIRKTEIEKAAEELTYRYLPDARENSQLLNFPQEIAKKMGLTIIRRDLHGCGKTRSILFFCKGEISVDSKDEATGEKIVYTETVDAKTIVINSHLVKLDLPVIDIYHEIIHYEWHYLFYRLQHMHNNDLRQIIKHYKIHFDPTGEQDPLSWLEWQARQGSMSMWMPLSFMNDQVSGRTEICGLGAAHRGEKFERIARGIAADHLFPKYRVRARLINMGHIEAKGALNYLGDKYAEPFSFNRDKGNSNYSFFIAPKDYLDLFKRDEEFRKLIRTGNFVYVDGHVCVADPEYVIQTDDGPQMTKWANAHVDQCCLRFIEIYEQDEVLTYRFGRLNSDVSYNDHFFRYPGCGDITKLTGEEKDQNLRAYAESLPRSFKAMLQRFMTDSGKKSEDLIRTLDMSESTVSRLRNNKIAHNKVDLVVSLIVFFHLPPYISRLFLESADVNVFNPDYHSGYALIVTSMYMSTIKSVQDTLAFMGCPPLLLTDEYEDEQCG